MKFLDFFFAARPMLHLPVWSVYLIALRFHLQVSIADLTGRDCGMLVCLSLLAAGAYFINQVYDYRSDEINEKLGFLQRGLFTKRELAAAGLVVMVLAMAGAAFYSLLVAAVVLQLIILGYAYSVPPVRLKDRPVGGLLANAYGFGFLVPLVASPPEVHDPGRLAWPNSFYFSLAVAAVYLLTTLPDREGDRAAGKRTLAVVLRPAQVKLLALLFWVLAGWVAYWSRQPFLSGLAIISLLPTCGALLVQSAKLDLLAAKLPILLLTLLAGYYFPAYFVFIIVLLVATRIYYRKRFNLAYPSLT